MMRKADLSGLRADFLYNLLPSPENPSILIDKEAAA